jgi:hypothetical protein
MSATGQKPATTPAERRHRRHPRYRGDFRVAVSHLLRHDYQKIAGHCVDLSEAGIGILLAAELGAGEVAGLTFSPLESAPAWEVRAVVRYRRGCQYGFEFLSLTDEQRGSLLSYLKTLKPID